MRPRTLDELWTWAFTESQSSVLEAPDRLHAKHPYPEKDSDLPDTPWSIQRGETQRLRPSAIVGPPFTRAFARYLDGGRPMTPIRRAVKDMVSPRARNRTLGERIVWAVVEGQHPDPDTVRAILRCSWSTFRSAAMPALEHLYDKTQRQIADEPKRLALTDEERSANVRAGESRASTAPQAGTRRRLRPGRERLAS